MEEDWDAECAANPSQTFSLLPQNGNDGQKVANYSSAFGGSYNRSSSDNRSASSGFGRDRNNTGYGGSYNSNYNRGSSDDRSASSGFSRGRGSGDRGWNDRPQNFDRGPPRDGGFQGSRGFGGRGGRGGRGRRGGRGGRYRDDDAGFDMDFDDFTPKAEHPLNGSQCSGTGEVRKEVQINANDIGKVIGRGGSKIKELESESGAKINIPRGGDSRVVRIEITGTAESAQKAVRLIDNIFNPIAQLTQSIADNICQDLADKGVTGERPKINWKQLHADREKNEALKWADLGPVNKDFYLEHNEVASMHPEEVEQIRKENNNIMVENLHENNEGVIPNPVRTFEEAFEHHPLILTEMKKAGFVKPSPIQMQGWPIALSGIDLIGIAQTGTGKTLAFLLPAFIHIDNQPVPRSERGGPTVLVLSPTRELALQIEQEVNKYSYKGIKCCCVYGGGSRKNQINIVQKGVEIIVATPGRLNDLINAEILSIHHVSFLVLDEADRMLDLGFEPEIRKVLLDIRPDRHTIMTSATWPEGVRRLARSYMKNPMQVRVGTLDLAAVHSVTQYVEIIADEDKRYRLIQFLSNELSEEDKVIVFVGKKLTADDIASDFAMQGIPCQSIHGNREQMDREQAIDDLKTGVVRILIATDVASRGIDIKDVTCVFNFDFPRNIEDYVHRVGRTGRAGRTGRSITLLTRGDWRNAADLIKIMEEANQTVPQELYNMADRFRAMKAKRREEGDDGRGRFGGGGRGGGGSFGGGFGGFGGGRRGGRRDRDSGIVFNQI